MVKWFSVCNWLLSQSITSRCRNKGIIRHAQRFVLKTYIKKYIKKLKRTQNMIKTWIISTLFRFRLKTFSFYLHFQKNLRTRLPFSDRFRGSHGTQNRQACWMLLWRFKMAPIWNRQTHFSISHALNMHPRTYKAGNNSIGKRLVRRYS